MFVYQYLGPFSHPFYTRSVFILLNILVFDVPIDCLMRPLDECPRTLSRGWSRVTVMRQDDINHMASSIMLSL